MFFPFKPFLIPDRRLSTLLQSLGSVTRDLEMHHSAETALPGEIPHPPTPPNVAIALAKGLKDTMLAAANLLLQRGQKQILGNIHITLTGEEFKVLSGMLPFAFYCSSCVCVLRGGWGGNLKAFYRKFTAESPPALLKVG